jgi:branched-chain amino acid transport system permease protein
MIEITLQYILNGIVTGSIYALIAIGLTLIFGLMDIANFAHGEFYMLGGYFAYSIMQLLHVDFFLSILLSALGVMAVGAVLDRFMFSRLREQPIMSTVLITIGLSIFLENLALAIWGPLPKYLKSSLAESTIFIGPLFMTWKRLFLMVVAIGILIIVHFVIKYTRPGKSMRATFQNKEAASLVGIDIGRVYSMTFMAGVGLASLAGALIGSIFFVYPTMGGTATVKAFIVVIVGGMGSFLGAIVSGFVLGIAESLGAGFISTGYKDAIGFIIIVIILLFKPEGLFRKV